jgi:hypothetical protein
VAAPGLNCAIWTVRSMRTVLSNAHSFFKVPFPSLAWRVPPRHIGDARVQIFQLRESVIRAHLPHQQGTLFMLITELAYLLPHGCSRRAPYGRYHVLAPCQQRSLPFDHQRGKWIGTAILDGYGASRSPFGCGLNDDRGAGGGGLGGSSTGSRGGAADDDDRAGVRERGEGEGASSAGQLGGSGAGGRDGNGRVGGCRLGRRREAYSGRHGATRA